MNKAVFLDRDGVINVDHAYVYKIEDFEFVGGVFEACRHFVQLGYKLIVVTNQSGIGRGYYSEVDFAHLTKWMKAQFSAQEAPLSEVYFCPHHPTNALAEYLQDCDCRKPAPGMLLQGISQFNIDAAQSIMIGDKLSDLAAGKAAGVARCVYIKDLSAATAQELAEFEIWPSLVSGIEKVTT